MEFVAHGMPLSPNAFTLACAQLDVSSATLWSVIFVETTGCGFLQDRRPTILFERHKFHLHTSGQFDVQAPSISQKRAGGYLGDAREYERLALARTLDAEAALLSTSWGLGQVLGANYLLAGYTQIEEFVRAMVASEDAQLLAMTHFITRHPAMLLALQKHNWSDFARAYNGPRYRRNAYDTKLAHMYSLFSTAKRALPHFDVRAAQIGLWYRGESLDIDGTWGPNTQAAVRRFQVLYHLPLASGTLSDATRTLLWTLMGWIAPADAPTMLPSTLSATEQALIEVVKLLQKAIAEIEQVKPLTHVVDATVVYLRQSIEVMMSIIPSKKEPVV